MISCVFAYAKGAETQTTVVEMADPYASLFLVRNDDRARAALRAWLTRNGHHGLSHRVGLLPAADEAATVPSKAA
jgi:hypothetical protein